MRGALNVLGLVILGLLVLLRRGFTALLDEPRETAARHHPYMRALIFFWGACALAFTALGLWTLATSGYLPVAGLLAFLLVALVQIARRKRAGG